MNNVIKAKFPDIEGAFLLISGRLKVNATLVKQFNTISMASFLLVGEDRAVEWEPNYGPIQIFHKATEDTPEDKKLKHYAFPYIRKPKFGEWSQCAVDYKCLPEAFINGNYKYIFSVLREWL
jgi:hypothetical protein